MAPALSVALIAVVVVCPDEVLSVVDTETTISETGQSEKVIHCLLWPKLQGCDQRCIK